MKRKYITPQSTAINLYTEGMIAASGDQITGPAFSSDKATSEGDVCTNRNAWDSSNWTDE